MLLGNFNVTASTALLIDLQYGVNYTVTVSTVNCAGESNFSAPLTVLLTAQGTCIQYTLSAAYSYCMYETLETYAFC